MHIIYILGLADSLCTFLLIPLSLVKIDVNNVHTGQVTELAIPFQWHSKLLHYGRQLACIATDKPIHYFALIFAHILEEGVVLEVKK